MPGAEERCGVDLIELLRRAALAAHAAGELDRALALIDEALAEPDAGSEPEREAQLLQVLARILLALGRHDRLSEPLARAAALLPADPPTVVRASVLASLAHRALIAQEFEAADSAAADAVAAAEAAGARRRRPTR